MKALAMNERITLPLLGALGSTKHCIKHFVYLVCLRGDFQKTNFLFRQSLRETLWRTQKSKHKQKGQRKQSQVFNHFFPFGVSYLTLFSYQFYQI